MINIAVRSVVRHKDSHTMNSKSNTYKEMPLNATIYLCLTIKSSRLAQGNLKYN